MKRRWTTERVELLRRLWAAGVSRAHIGVALDLAPDSVEQAVCRLRRKGVEMPRRHAGRPVWTPGRVAQAAAALRAGADEATVAAVMGVSAQSVRSTLGRLRREGHDLGDRPP